MDEYKDARRRIRITNFGAIKKIDMRLDSSLQVVIGPQASGKSTLAKVIFFCRKIRDYLVIYAQDIWMGHITEETNTSFEKYLRNPFMGCFGTTKHMDFFHIIYTYDEEKEKSVSITLGEDRFVLIKFSKILKTEIGNLLRDVYQVASINRTDFFSDYSNQRSFLELFKKQASMVFADTDKLLYIPAGRNMLATVPDLIQPESAVSQTSLHVDISQIDLVTQDFISYIQSMRRRFGSKLEEIKQNYLKTVSGSIRNKDVDLACELIRRILKADYIYEKDGERLYYSEGKWTKLMFGSSGQQEVLWALNCIFLAVLQQEKTFLVFEEPEAHIFPDSQELIACLVALLINSTSSEVFITTHSPYILTSVNLLVYSGEIEESRQKESVVDWHYRLRRKNVGAYFVSEDGGELTSLMQDDSPLINAAWIDGISESINCRMDKLVDLEMSQKEAKKNDM